MDMSKVIDEAKKKLDVESDYALAKKLEIPKQRIADYRLGVRTPDAYACARLAEVLGMDPFELLAQVEAATEKNEGRRAYWKKVAERMATTSLAVFFVLVALPEQSKASAGDVIDSQKAVIFRSIDCMLILSSNRRGCIHSVPLSRCSSTATAGCIEAQSSCCTVRFLSLPGK